MKADWKGEFTDWKGEFTKAWVMLSSWRGRPEKVLMMNSEMKKEACGGMLFANRWMVSCKVWGVQGQGHSPLTAHTPSAASVHSRTHQL